MKKQILALAFSLLAFASAYAQSNITLPIPAMAVADIGNGPIKVRVVQGNASVFTSQGSGVGSTSGSSTALTLTATPITPPIVGALISGTGITSGTTVTAYNGTTGVTLSAAMTVASATISWGAACPSTPPAQSAQASVSAEYLMMYTQARVCAVSPGGPANTLLILPVFYSPTSPDGGRGTSVFHAPVAAASTGNVNIGSAPASLDSVTGVPGQRWLLKNQTAASQNGVYVFNGTGSQLTRASDWTTGQVVQGNEVYVSSGTFSANATYAISTADPITVGATALTFNANIATSLLEFTNGANVSVVAGDPASCLAPGDGCAGGILTQGVPGNGQAVSYQVVPTVGTVPTNGPISEFVTVRTTGTNYQRLSFTSMAAFADPGHLLTANDYRIQMESGGTAPQLPLRLSTQQNTDGSYYEHLELGPDGNILVFPRMAPGSSGSPNLTANNLAMVLGQTQNGLGAVLTSAGTQDSPQFIQFGNSYDTTLHTRYLKQYVGMTSNAGAGTWHVQTQLDSGGYSDLFQCTTAGVCSLNTLAATQVSTAGLNTITEHITQSAVAAAPSAGTLNCWADSTNLGWWCQTSASVQSRTAVVKAAVGSNWLRSFGNDGTFTASQPACSDLSGVGTGCSAAAGITALTGDVTATGPGSAASTLATAQPGAHTWAAAQTFSALTTHSGAGVAYSGAISQAAWTTTGLLRQHTAATFTDTSSSGTVAAAYTNAFGGNTIAASSATTYTRYVGANFTTPVAGTNVTMTSAIALAADNVSIGGAVIGANALAVTGTVNFSAGLTMAGNLTTAAGAVVGFSGRSYISSPSDGVFFLQNNASTDFGRLQFGGTTSSFPALKRSGTTLAVRLADDSADAPITASNGTFSGQLNVTTMTQTATAQSGTVCYNSGTGAITYDATVGCLTSTLTEKDDWQDITPQEALATVLKMQAGSYTYKTGRGLPKGPQIGLAAEQLADIDDRLVGHRPDGSLQGVRYSQASALYPMAIQALRSEIADLRKQLHQ